MATSIIDVHELEKLRPLGKLEEFSSSRHHLGFYHNIGISATYFHPSKYLVSLRTTVFSALAVVINRHSILSAIPIDEDSTAPYFARLLSFNLEEAVTSRTRQHPLPKDGTDIELDSILQDQHNTSFKARYGQLPFWRLIVLTNPTVTGIEFTASFIFHHSLGDGTTGLIFHKDFLSALSSSPPLTSTTIPTPSTTIPLTLEAIHPLPIHPSPPAPELPNVYQGTPIFFPLHSHFRSLTIAASTTKALLTVCRRNNTTLTATFLVLLASALSHLLPAHYKAFEATIPVSLRRYLPTPFTNTQEMGIFIDAFSAHYVRGPFSWDAARASKATIDAYLECAVKGQFKIAKFKNISDMREYFSGRVGKERGSSFGVSSLGVLKVEGENGDKTDKKWKMGRVLFSRSAFVAGSAFSTGLVTGPDGFLSIGFEWQEGAVEKDLVEKVIDYVRGEISRIANE